MKRFLICLPLWMSCSEISSTEVPNEIQLALGGTSLTHEIYAQQTLILSTDQGQILDSTLSDSLGRFSFKSLRYENLKSYKIISADSNLQAWWIAGQESDQISLNSFSTWLAQNPLPKGQFKKYKDSLSNAWFGPGFTLSILNQSGPLSATEFELKKAFCAALWNLSRDKNRKQLLKISLQNKMSIYDSEEFLTELIQQSKLGNLTLKQIAELIWLLSQKDSALIWEQRLQQIKVLP